MRCCAACLETSGVLVGSGRPGGRARGGRDSPPPRSAPSTASSGSRSARRGRRPPAPGRARRRRLAARTSSGTGSTATRTSSSCCLRPPPRAAAEATRVRATSSSERTAGSTGQVRPPPGRVNVVMKTQSAAREKSLRTPGRPPTSMCSVPSPSTRHSPLPCGSSRQAVRFRAESKDNGRAGAGRRYRPRRRRLSTAGAAMGGRGRQPRYGPLAVENFFAFAPKRHPAEATTLRSHC